MQQRLPTLVTPNNVAQATSVALGLGANLGDAAATLRSTLATLASWPTVLSCQCSSLYKTSPIDASGDDYINAVAILRFSTPQHLLSILSDCQSLEYSAGRTREFRNAPRTLDIDLLLAWFDTQPILLQHPRLQLPHPRMHTRAFVLVPLAELDSHLNIAPYGNLQDLLPSVSQQGIIKLHA